MKIGEILTKTRKELEDKAEFNLANLEAEILLSFILNKPKEFLYSHPEKEISSSDNRKLNKLIKKRLCGFPVAYLIGHKEFYGLDFIVNKHVLIPRPETEILVEEILKNTKHQIPNTIIDVGTGSGCIIISLAKNITDKTVNFYGLDISKQALKIAKKNARLNGLTSRITFLHSNLLKKVLKRNFSEPVIITANLPYLTSEQIKNSPSIKKEPKLALSSGLNGLNHYRQLLIQIKQNFKLFKGGLEIFCEIDDTQKEAIKKLIKKELPLAKIEIKKDLGAFDRLVKITF